MNKAKLDTIMFEILTELELNDVKEAVKAEYEKHLFDNLHALFRSAAYGRIYTDEDKESTAERRAYMKVKPLVDEAVDKYMNKLMEDSKKDES